MHEGNYQQIYHTTVDFCSSQEQTLTFHHFFFLFKFLFLFSLKNYNTNVKIKNIQKFFIQQTQNKTFKSKS